MKAIRYVSAVSPESAAKLSTANDGRYLGGGIDLLGELKEYLISAGTLVDIKNLPGLREIRIEAEKVILGANVTVANLAAHSEIGKLLPGLQEAAADVGSPQIRNVATLGGNLAQHSRCWYYRHRDVNCLKKGGSICHARDGASKFSSFISGNPCISPVVSNLGTALTALQASVVILRDAKEVTLTLPQLYEKAWENPAAHNSLLPNDLIVRVEVPLAAAKSAYIQVSEKADFDWALVSCCVALQMNGANIASGRVVLGAVAPVPYQTDAANQLLNGSAPNEETAKRVADELLKKATPFKENGYKIPIARALIRRALLQAANRS